MKIRVSPLILAILSASATQALADDDLSINGFLSAGVGTLSTDDIAINGYDEDISFKPDTVLGLQVSKHIQGKFSLTGQLVARGPEEFDLDAAWAYATYDHSDETSIRFGRLRAPFFYYSDFLEVGYAYNWIRPPAEVYRIGFSSIDGVDVTHQLYFGDIDASVQVYYGRFNDDLTIGGNDVDFDLTNFTGVVFNASMEPFAIRLSYHRAALTSEALSASAPPTDDEFLVDEDVSTFLESAFVYDDGDNQVVIELTALDHDSASLTDDTAFLVHYARRMNDFTPHITYAHEKDDVESGSTGDIQKAVGLENELVSYIAGLRYDVETNVALKIEAQYRDEKTRSAADGEDGMLYSAAIDMLF